MPLTRAQIEELGWEKINTLDMLIHWGREKQDAYVPLMKGDYRLYHCYGHSRIRITFQNEYSHCCVFLGKCENAATLSLIMELIGIE